MRQYLFMLGMLVAAGCARAAPAPAPSPLQAGPPPAKETTMPASAAAPATTAAKSYTEPTASTVDPAKQYIATITTARGAMVVQLDPEAAPLGVTNFLQLVQGGFYNGLTFHRVEPGFVIQGGDPQGDGRGGPGYTLPAEIGLTHVKGAIAWARLGDAVNAKRRSSGSQFYITLAPTPFLDGQYSVFGRVVSGLETAERIQRGDTIEKITVEIK